MTMTDAGQVAALTVSYLVDAALRTIIVAGAAGVGLLGLSRWSAAGKLRIWRAVLAVALTMPVLSRVVPEAPIALPFLGSAFARIEQSIVPPPGEVTVTRSVPQESDLSRTAALGGTAEVPWGIIVIAIYLAGTALLLGRLVVGGYMARRLFRRSRPVLEFGPLQRLEQLAVRESLGRSPVLRESDAACVPLTMGVIRPSIVLPHDWRAWPGVQFDAVLVHELGHVARRDILTQRLALIYRALAWYNPASWWLHRQVTELAEHASDDAVLASGVDSVTYAEALVGFFAKVRGTGRAVWHVAMASGRAESATRRVERVLNWTAVPASGRQRAVSATLVALIAPLSLLAASIVPIRAQDSLPVPVPAPVPAPAAPEAAPPVPAAVPLPAPVVSRAPGNERARVITPRAVVQGEQPAAEPVPVAHPAPAAVPPLPVPAPAVTPAAPPAAPFSRAVTPVPVPAAPQAPSRPATLALRSPATATFTTLAQAGAGDREDEFMKGVYPASTIGLTNPRLLKDVMPRYTREAMAAKVQGIFYVQIVVMPDGSVGRARLTKIAWLNPPPIQQDENGRSVVLELFGLDQEAIKAVLGWQFEPGRLNGDTVPVAVEGSLSFRIF